MTVADWKSPILDDDADRLQRRMARLRALAAARAARAASQPEETAGVSAAARGWSSPSWGGLLLRAPSAARLRAIDDINALVDQRLIDVDVALRARTLVDHLFDRNTVYATISPDDGGVVFYWRAGDMSIEVDLYADRQDGSWWRISNVAAYTDSDHHSRDLPPHIAAKLRYSLAHFSKEVDRVNPDWRKQTH